MAASIRVGDLLPVSLLRVARISCAILGNLFSSLLLAAAIASVLLTCDLFLRAFSCIHVHATASIDADSTRSCLSCLPAAVAGPYLRYIPVERSCTH